MGTRKSLLRACAVFFAIFVTNTTAGPTKLSTRTVREVYPEIEPESDGNQAQVCIVGDVVYGIDEPVPAEQPCLKCRCQPPGVQCETIKCAKKPGCKAIHKPNKCCPEYQCECHHDGKIYANGERLNTPPATECKVCYCRGGEVQCAEVSCYVRNDCAGKTVPGQCCPKYDHCPPKEPLLEQPTPPTPALIPNINKEVLELWPLAAINSSDENTSPDANKIDTDSVTVVTDKQIEQPKITIQEIIPEVREIPVTAPSKTLVLSEAKDSIDSNDVVTDSEPDSSEISEVFQHPPPVLKIGDKLLFLKQGELVAEKDGTTPTSVITIIGAEGLQRGFEDSAEHEHLLFNNSNDLEPKTSESTHILSLVKLKKKQTEAPVTETTTEEVTETEIPTTTVATKTLLEENPAYPLIPDVMTQQTDDGNLTVTQSPENTTMEVKILPEVLEIRSNKTVPQNTSHATWLKDEETLFDVKAILPDEILKQRAPSDETTTTTTEESEETTTEEVTTEITSTSERSVESMETIEDSSEATTPKGNHASLISNEDASVEPSEPSEISDMLSTPRESKIDDVEVIDGKSEASENTTKPMLKDVEIITEPAKKIVGKRENSLKDQEDEIFRELQDELNTDATERTLSEEEDKEESDRIFQELLEETSTPRSKNLNKDSQTLQRVTDAIAKLTLGRQNSPNILNVLTNFFGSNRQK